MSNSCSGTGSSQIHFKSNDAKDKTKKTYSSLSVCVKSLCSQPLVCVRALLELDWSAGNIHLQFYVYD